MLKHTLLATLRRIVLPVVMALVPLTVFAQQIDMSLDKVTVRRAMEYLQREYGYSISVRSDEVDISRIITVNVRDASLRQALDQIFTGQDVDYSIDGKSVSVRARKSLAQSAPKLAARVIHGKIIDEDSEPLAGASVIEKGTTNGTVADENGNYSIELTTENPVLQFSFFGFADEEIAVGKSDELDVRMTAQSLSLDDVVVVGYGSMTRRDITSAIGSFTPKPAERREVLSVDQLLQGRVAGVNISTASGIPGSVGRVSIRGIGSLNAGNEPLYVIDGIPLTTTSGDTGAWSSGESMSGLASINPSDIESRPSHRGVQ